MLQLKLGLADDGRMLAIAYENSGEDIIVRDVEVVADEAEAGKWFTKIAVERPWVERQ
jgi:hypothetical protein